MDDLACPGTLSRCQNRHSQLKKAWSLSFRPNVSLTNSWFYPVKYRQTAILSDRQLLRADALLAAQSPHRAARADAWYQNAPVRPESRDLLG